MKARLIGLALVCAATSAPAVTQSAAGGDLYLVVFKNESLPANAAAVIERAGARLQRPFPEVGVASIFADPAAAATLAKEASVLAVGPEHAHAAPQTAAAPDALEPLGGPTDDDFRYAYQWNMRRIHAPDLWARLPLAGETPVVAVIDTGVMDDHPDLEGQVIASKAFSYCPSSGGPNGTDGYPVYSRAMMFSGAGRFQGCGDIDPMYESHGTQVAGIIAAKFGGGRMVGVDPDIRVASYKVFDHARRTINGEVVDRLNVYETSIFRALMDVAQSGYRVINLSLGGPAEMSDRSDRASWLAWNRVAGYLDRRGVLLVASAGNEAWNLNGTTGEAPGDLPTVIDVSASAWTKLLLDGDGWYVPAPGSTDWLAPYSNFGAAIDLTAPGGDCREDPSGVLNCLWQYAIYTDLILPDGSVAHGWGTGTSMAAPHVSAIAAAVRALHPDWDPGTVRSYLKDTAEKIGDRQSFGHGMISADQVQ